MHIPVIRKVLERNEAAAAENRAWLDRRGVYCVNLLGGAGSGKTSLLEALLPRLAPELRPAVLEGDLATTRDAERIHRLGVPVVQLLTEGGCHLKAEHVQRAMQRPELEGANLLIIENVGNLVCPANFDLGEHARIVVLSVVEGDDKPAKYGLMFRRADLVVLSKWDLREFVPFDAALARHDLRIANPSLEIIETDTRSQRGVARVADWLARRIHAHRVARPVSEETGHAYSHAR